MTTNSDNKYYNQYQNSDQDKYKSSQDVLTVDFDKLYSSFIVPVDALRSHFNALIPGSQELNTPQYQESRCHAFYRMIGFPVVANGSNFYSPGYDPNLNTDSSGLDANKKISDMVSSNLSLTSQFSYRENIPISFRKIFSDGGITAQAVDLGSLFIRDFGQQLGSTEPLVDDPNKVQNIDERTTEILRIFGNSDVNPNFLRSTHPIKPFTVDPRIDSSVRPIVNRICAPFLKDKSQTKIFTSQTGTSGNLQRPYIEKVITTRFNNNNVTLGPGQDVINVLLTNVTNNKQQTDKQLVDTASNPLKQLYSSEITIFNNYIKIIQIVTEELVRSIRRIQYNRQTINFQPIPDPKNGPESGTDGNKINPVDPTDTLNNRKIESDIIQATQKKILHDIAFDTGIFGVPDPGDFAFSNLDDSVFSIDKNVQTSYQDNLDSLTQKRDQMGNENINFLRNIEIIMGEFSGIGLMDMIAMQAALWIMDPSALLGLIDVRAFGRISLRKDINLGGTTQLDILSSLANFEQILDQIYNYTQGYLNGINNGTTYKASGT